MFNIKTHLSILVTALKSCVKMFNTYGTTTIKLTSYNVLVPRYEST